jgi:hypothetical protein
MSGFVFSNILYALIPSQLTVERLTVAPFSSIQDLLLSDFNIYSSATLRQLMLVCQSHQNLSRKKINVWMNEK